MERDQRAYREAVDMPTQKLRPPTFGERLREELKGLGRTAVRLGGTLLAGITAYTLTYAGLITSGVGVREATIAAVGVLAGTMSVSHFWLMPRLVRRYPSYNLLYLPKAANP